MAIYKQDGYNGSFTDSSVSEQLYCTEAVTAGQWIAIHWNDLTNPGAIQGESYRIADSDEETYDVVGVALQTTTAAGFVQVQVRGVCPTANIADAASTIGQKLAISSTAGRAEAYSGTNPALRVIGAVVTAPSSNVGSCRIYPHEKFISP